MVTVAATATAVGGATAAAPEGPLPGAPGPPGPLQPPPPPPAALRPPRPLSTQDSKFVVDDGRGRAHGCTIRSPYVGIALVSVSARSVASRSEALSAAAALCEVRVWGEENPLRRMRDRGLPLAAAAAIADTRLGLLPMPRQVPRRPSPPQADDKETTMATRRWSTVVAPHVRNSTATLSATTEAADAVAAAVDADASALPPPRLTLLLTPAQVVAVRRSPGVTLRIVIADVGARLAAGPAMQPVPDVPPATPRARARTPRSASAWAPLIPAATSSATASPPASSDGGSNDTASAGAEVGSIVPMTTFYADYRDSATLAERAAALAAAYPRWARVEEYGTSVEGRPLWVLRVGGGHANKTGDSNGDGHGAGGRDGPDGPPPLPGRDARRVLVTGLLHAREWISGAATLAAAEALLRAAAAEVADTEKDGEVATVGMDKDRPRKKAEGAAATAVAAEEKRRAAPRAAASPPRGGIAELLTTVELLAAPVTNPDGYVHTAVDRLWRKNRNPNGGADIDGSSPDCVGVDLNRNWGTDWGGLYQAPIDPCAGEFIGSGPFSEPEVAALRALVVATTPAVHLDVHAFGQLVLGPWSYTDEPPPGLAISDPFWRHVAAVVTASRGALYKYGRGSDLLYLASGIFPDWTYSVGAMSATFEVRPPYGDDGEEGFQLRTSAIRPVSEEATGAVLVALRYAAAVRGEFLSDGWAAPVMGAGDEKRAVMAAVAELETAVLAPAWGDAVGGKAEVGDSISTGVWMTLMGMGIVWVLSIGAGGYAILVAKVY
ncbi:hypothetical protein MMPV_000815 [Pyropia vietnamensis]